MLKWMSGTGNVMFRFGIKVQGRPLLMLTTVGARSGKARKTVLGWFADDRDHSWIVVASNGGAPRHPGWAYNLAAHPERARIDLGDGEIPVQAEVITGSERLEVWDMVTDLAPGYGRYTEKTDREIPLFRLTRR
jgi:deazaflavin-dependent oxidoreductase (nitroreductase family)